MRYEKPMFPQARRPPFQPSLWVRSGPGPDGGGGGGGGASGATKETDRQGGNLEESSLQQVSLEGGSLGFQAGFPAGPGFGPSPVQTFGIDVVYTLALGTLLGSGVFSACGRFLRPGHTRDRCDPGTSSRLSRRALEFVTDPAGNHKLRAGVGRKVGPQ
jgi:hypothetical protein